jgi:hypothetical protein
MCFSATASFTAAAVIGVVGILALSKARTFPWVMFAATPLFFALQQVFEGIVWITLAQGDSTSLLSMVGLYGFLFFAGIFWPISIASCLYLLENDKKRKKALFIIFILGIIVAIEILIRLVNQSHTATICGHHIIYPVFELTYSANSVLPFIYTHFFVLLLTAAYFIAVTAPFFISSIKGIWVLGLITAAGFIVAEIFYEYASASVWCFFAALSTLATYHFVASYNKNNG